MSIKYNGKLIAGKYKTQVVTDATEGNKGLIRIATLEEVNTGTDNTTAVTPKGLATKQDKLIVGTGIEITEDNVINNTQTSAEWGNIQGDISAQTDLQAALDNKQDKLTEGTGITISGNKISNAFTSLDNYTTFSQDRLTVEQSFVYKKAANIYARGNFSNFVNSIIKPTFATKTELNTKQDKLVSATNIKTINNESLLGEGNIEVKSGGSGLELCDIGMALYVDETKGLRRYLNGQIVDINTNTQAFLDRLKQITTLHPSLLCTEEQWQSAKTMSAFGQVGKFVFNHSGDEIVSVRIPRVVNVQGLFDLQNLGMTVSAGLPNITGYGTGNVIPNSEETTYYGALYKYTSGGSFGNTSPNGLNRYNIGLDASRSSSIYGKSNTVQQEAIQYPYFIQIATGAETENNIINEIELNNPYSLFDSKYSDHELNNLSWLKSEGQWNAKAVYPTAYNKILENVNNGVEGYKGVGYAYVYNGSTVTAWITAPTPVVGATVYGWEPCHKIGTVESCTDNTITFFNKETNETTTVTRKADSDLPITSTYWITDYDFVLNTADETFRLPLKNHTADDGNSILTLYYYVGETVQNANLIDAGRIGEQLATKTDMLQASGAGMPSNRYIDLTLGASGSTYTAPANGWFCILKRSTKTNEILELSSTSTGFGFKYASTGVQACFVSCPVKKGDIIKCGYTTTGETKFFRFIYAEGEV